MKLLYNINCINTKAAFLYFIIGYCRCSQPSKFLECNNGTTIPLSAILERQGGVRGSGLPLWANTAVLVTFFIVFRTLGYLVLRYYRVPQ